MPPELHPRCVSCGHVRCTDCLRDTVQPSERDDELMYSKLTKTGNTENNEAPAPQTGRAALLPAGNTAAEQALPSTKNVRKDLTRSSQNRTGLIGVPEPETSRFGEDGECTPRSCQWDHFDPPDLLINDKDKFQADLFDTELSFDFEDLLNSQVDLSSSPYFVNQGQWDADIVPNDGVAATCHPLPQLIGDISGTEPPVPYENGYDLRIQKLGTDSAYEHTVEPQVPLSSSFEEASSYSGYQLSGNSALWISQANELAPGSVNQQATPIYAPTAQTVDPSLLLSSIEPLKYPSEVFSPPEPLPSSSLRAKNEDDEQITDEGPISRVCRKDGYAGEACESCLSTSGSAKAKALACLFYKRNPELYSSCIYKSFKTISALRQHLDNEHKLGPYHCTSCWDSFSDKKSLETHTNCQQTGGIPVDKLPTISKARGSPNTKWYWTFKKLFGESSPLPRCPHTHPIPDMKYHNIRQFIRYLASKGTMFTISDIEDAMPRWIASNPESSSALSMDIRQMPTPIDAALDINMFDR
ncbi:hypothetical protein F5Y05DRAFT_309990 [Hypoxylon sp. FL0543]|nr:hypothetical protein F5Y05DRAFT_309990 [Hypoxylon sp. FL0543]